VLSSLEMLDVVRVRGHDLERACADLVAAASAQGGRDTISVILARHGA
jgi:hypothetical protein